MNKVVLILSVLCLIAGRQLCDSSNNLRPRTDEPTLFELYDQLKSIFDLEAITSFLKTKAETDRNAAKLILNISAYMHSEDAAKICRAFFKEVGVQNIIHYLTINGVTPLYDNDKHNLNLKSRRRHAQKKAPITFEKVANALSLFQEFMDQLPRGHLRRFLEHAMKTKAGIALYSRLAQKDVKRSYWRIMRLKKMKRLEGTLLANGFELIELRFILEAVMNWAEDPVDVEDPVRKGSKMFPSFGWNTTFEFILSIFYNIALVKLILSFISVVLH